MFFDDALKEIFGQLGLFLQFAVDGDFIAWLKIPRVALGLGKDHASFGLGEHRVVGFGSNFGGQGSAVGKFEACEPTGRVLFASGLLSFGQDGRHFGQFWVETSRFELSVGQLLGERGFIAFDEDHLWLRECAYTRQLGSV